MIDIKQLKDSKRNIICIGNHKTIIQSILDFDYLSGKKEPSIVGIIATGRRYERYFFGRKEIFIPVLLHVDELSSKNIVPHLFLHLTSARRVLPVIHELFEKVQSLLGGVVFAENLPEQHAIRFWKLAQDYKKFIIGPASVGLLIPGVLKLGPIGGVQYKQLLDAHVFTQGSTAVFAASGGMTNEIVHLVTKSNHRLSFALHFGGDRFPSISPKDAFNIAQNDPQTKTIIYFGEVGGFDEYDIAEMLIKKQVTKGVYCYIAGSISEYFETPPQFGHAKAMARTEKESAKAKRDVLKIAGAHVAETFSEFVTIIRDLPPDDSWTSKDEERYNTYAMELHNRKSSLISSSIANDKNGVATLLGQDLLQFSKENSFAGIVASLFLGRKIVSKEFETLTDFILKLLVDHGPYVSGAVNTIITARAGRDLVSSLAAGLLTIGPRFGGAVNEAAAIWVNGVVSGKSPVDYVEEFASKKLYISGIGHKKYRIDFPDPRVTELLQFTNALEKKRFSIYAREIEKITTAKKGNLILNIDGVIAAVLLDILSEKEGLSDDELKRLTEVEFFNTFFVLSRSVGFIAHFLDQKRLDEGLFRLGEEHVAEAEITKS